MRSRVPMASTLLITSSEPGSSSTWPSAPSARPRSRRFARPSFDGTVALGVHIIARQEIFRCARCECPHVDPSGLATRPFGLDLEPVGRSGRRSCGAEVAGSLNATAPPRVPLGVACGWMTSTPSTACASRLDCPRPPRGFPASSAAPRRARPAHRRAPPTQMARCCDSSEIPRPSVCTAVRAPGPGTGLDVAWFRGGRAASRRPSTWTSRT